MKHLKPHTYRIKWALLLGKLLLSDSAFRTFHNSLHANPQTLPELSHILRKLLQRNPKWFYGHYLLGIISYLQYQYTKLGSHKGTLLICRDVLQDSKDTHKEDKDSTVLDILALFINKRYDSVIEKEATFSSILLKDEEKKLVYEACGFSHLISGNDSAARNAFSLIPSQIRSHETATAVKKLEGSL